VRLPQSSVAIRVREKRPLAECEALQAAILKAESALGAEGRVLVRYSGTEPKIRMLVEGPDEKKVARWMDRLRAAVSRELEIT
jgi:phosphoglucosamine mutase